MTIDQMRTVRDDLDLEEAYVRGESRKHLLLTAMECSTCEGGGCLRCGGCALCDCNCQRCTEDCLACYGTGRCGACDQPRVSMSDQEWLEREADRAEAEQYLEEAIQAAGNYYRA